MLRFEPVEGQLSEVAVQGGGDGGEFVSVCSTSAEGEIDYERGI